MEQGSHLDEDNWLMALVMEVDTSYISLVEHTAKWLYNNVYSVLSQSILIIYLCQDLVRGLFSVVLKFLKLLWFSILIMCLTHFSLLDCITLTNTVIRNSRSFPGTCGVFLRSYAVNKWQTPWLMPPEVLCRIHKDYPIIPTLVLTSISLRFILILSSHLLTN